MNKSTTSMNLKSLIIQPSRLSCIDQVKENIDDILLAREQKISWQTIADALGLQRCTVINAVRTLSMQSTVSSIDCVPAPTIKNIIFSAKNKQPNLILATQPHTPQKNSIGLQTLGRTKVEDFNLSK